MQQREKGLLPKSNDPANNMSGDLELDSEVASIVLNTMQDRLPNYRWYDREGNLNSVRGKKDLKQRKIQLLPIHLFSINWALSNGLLPKPRKLQRIQILRSHSQQQAIMS